MRLCCPYCNTEYDIDDSRAGQIIQCARCAEEFSVPMPPPPPTEAIIIEPDPVSQEEIIEPDPVNKTCPMCGETILFVAKKCRYCGEILDEYGCEAVSSEIYPQPPQPPQLLSAFKSENPAKVSCLGQIFLFFVFAMFLVWVGTKCDSSQKTKDPMRDDAQACVFARQEIMKSVRTPSTAKVKFDHLNITFNKDIKTYTIPGYVDAQNLFGATIRNHFIVYVETDGSGGYRVLRVEWK